MLRHIETPRRHEPQICASCRSGCYYYFKIVIVGLFGCIFSYFLHEEEKSLGANKMTSYLNSKLGNANRTSLHTPNNGDEYVYV